MVVGDLTGEPNYDRVGTVVIPRSIQVIFCYLGSETVRNIVIGEFVLYTSRKVKLLRG